MPGDSPIESTKAAGLSPRGDDGTVKAEATAESFLVKATESSTERTESHASDPLPRRHELKTWPNYFAAIAARNKTFEARKNDRDFREGDVLTLREYDGFAGYSGRYATARISYVMNGATAGGTDFGIKDGYCVLALRDVQVFPHA